MTLKGGHIIYYNTVERRKPDVRFGKPDKILSGFRRVRFSEVRLSNVRAIESSESTKTGSKLVLNRFRTGFGQFGRYIRISNAQIDSGIRNPDNIVRLSDVRAIGVV